MEIYTTVNKVKVKSKIISIVGQWHNEFSKKAIGNVD